MGKRSARNEFFQGNISSILRGFRALIQSKEQLGYENKTGRNSSCFTVVNHSLKSQVREICTPGSVRVGLVVIQPFYLVSEE